MKKALRFFAGGLLASAVFASTAASAAPVTFKLNGLFSGTVNGESFSDEYVTFQGVGDTNNKTFDSGIVSYVLSSMTAYHGSAVYDFGDGMYFGLSPVPWGADSNWGGFYKRTTVFDPIFVYSSQLLVIEFPAAYDGSSSAPSTPVSAPLPFGSTFSGPNFTNGAITNATGLTFSISVAAVPEIETWSLLMMGCGAVGYAMRRRARMNIAVRYA